MMGIYVKDKCGIVGIYSEKPESVPYYLYYSLYALQHRGQESAGMATYQGKIVTYKSMGLVCNVFDKKKLDSLRSHVGIGHVRYSTTGKSEPKNSQPFTIEFEEGQISVAHNGDIINSRELRKDLKSRGYNFYSTTDSEIIAHLFCDEYSKTNDVLQAIKNALKKIIGSYSLVILINDDLYAIRDPFGIRPLVFGKDDESKIVASETVALDVVNIDYKRDIKPGEILHLNTEKSYELGKEKRRAHCIFEYVYFARPDSIINGRKVYKVRLNIGKALYREDPIDADMVAPVPDSAIPAAIGYSRESGIPYGEAFIKNRYIGRTFIMPTQKSRESAVKLKMNPLKTEVEGKRIVLIDDSIVRGTTIKQLVNVLKNANAKEIHLRIGCPPIKHPCYYGIAIRSEDELIASNKDVEEIRKILGVNSLKYLTIESLVKCIGISKKNLCTGCLDGEYPTLTPDEIRKIKPDIYHY